MPSSPAQQVPDLSSERKAFLLLLVLAKPCLPPPLPHVHFLPPQLQPWQRLPPSSVPGGLPRLKGPGSPWHSQPPALEPVLRPGLCATPAWRPPPHPPAPPAVSSPGMEPAAASPLTSSPLTSCLYRLMTWVRLSLACRISAGRGRRGDTRLREHGGLWGERRSLRLPQPWRGAGAGGVPSARLTQALYRPSSSTIPTTPNTVACSGLSLHTGSAVRTPLASLRGFVPSCLGVFGALSSPHSPVPSLPAVLHVTDHHLTNGHCPLPLASR